CRIREDLPQARAPGRPGPVARRPAGAVRRKARARARLRHRLPGAAETRSPEISGGPGYWTPLIAARAESVTALDYNEETLQIARSKAYPKKNVSFQQGDAYALPGSPHNFGGCFAAVR